MKKYLIVFGLALGLFACGVSKQVEKNFDFGLRAMTVPQIAVSKFLAESTASILESDSLENGTSIFIRSLNAHFFDTKHSFDLNVDSVTATVSKDTIIFSKIASPLRNQYLLSDTIEVKVTCRYLLRDSLADRVEKCLLSNYVIYGYAVIQKDKYIPCTMAANLNQRKLKLQEAQNKR